MTSKHCSLFMNILVSMVVQAQIKSCFTFTEPVNFDQNRILILKIGSGGSGEGRGALNKVQGVRTPGGVGKGGEVYVVAYMKGFSR